jgi:hypothetical protein
MKNSNIFLILMLSLVSMFIIPSCDQTSDLHNSNLKPNDDVALTTRGNCTLCPDDDECCCAVWLQPGNQSASLFICGTSNGVVACIGSASGNCPSFTGGGVLASLNSTDPLQPFCLNEDTPFYIRNLNPSVIANIIVSCQVDLVAPDTMWLQIPGGATVYIQGNSSCVLEPCN